MNIKYINGYGTIIVSVSVLLSGNITVIVDASDQRGLDGEESFAIHTTTRLMFNMPHFPLNTDGLMRMFPIYVEFGWKLEKAKRFELEEEKILVRHF